MKHPGMQIYVALQVVTDFLMYYSIEITDRAGLQYRITSHMFSTSVGMVAPEQL